MCITLGNASCAPRLAQTGSPAGVGNRTWKTVSTGRRSATAISATSSDASKRIVLIGMTGGTGRSALQGLLTSLTAPDDGSCTSPYEVHAVTRDMHGGSARAFQQQAQGRAQLIQADLEDRLSLERALRGAHAVYCHALSKDGKTADPLELSRARMLAAAAKNTGVDMLLYNSSGGKGCGYGISQMEQKHAVEDILAPSVPTFVALQATLFMEELWKPYTRPGILKGTFTFSVPSDRPIQLLAARDMGTAAGRLMSGQAQLAPGTKAIELAGDELSPAQMCEAFEEVQAMAAASGVAGVSPHVTHNRAPAWPFWLIARDVYRISRFLSERGYGGNVEKCEQLFPGMLSFREFLALSQWADPSKTYAAGITFTGDTSLLTQQQAQTAEEANVPAA